MRKIFNDLADGLQEVLDYKAGKPNKLRISSVMIEPLKLYEKEDIKKIRENAGMSQSVFAEMIGVSKKTIEAWESGSSSPQGPARRILEFLDNDSDFAIREGLVTCVS